ncbi:MAG: hypothetical protein HC848_05630 [Limnobacter sp.]|nr:hypothetical protein [Limnobacter sp.]
MHNKKLHALARCTLALALLVAGLERGYAQQTQPPELGAANPQQTFGEQLEQRRISDYADPQRSFFDRGVNLTIDTSVSSSDDNVNLFPVSSRSTGAAVSVDASVSNRLSLSLSTSLSNSRTYVDGVASTTPPQLVDKSRTTATTVGGSFLLLPQSASWPLLTLNTSLGQVSQSSLDYTSFSTGVRFSRDLESSALYGGISVTRDFLDTTPDINTVDGDLGVALVVNHRFSISGGVGVSRQQARLTQYSASVGVNYAIDSNLIASTSLRVPLSGLENGATLRFSLTSSFGNGI